MGIEFDPSPQLAQYAHPERLVTSAWLGAKLGMPELKVIESNEDSLLYDIGHIPTAHRIDWSKDLNDPVCRDFIDGQAFADLMNSKGISREDTVVIYGDHSNVWAVYTLWLFELFGHPDVRLLDGGRDAWMQEEKETSYDVPSRTSQDYPVVERDDSTHRVFADELLATLDDRQIVDLRDPAEFKGVPADVIAGKAAGRNDSANKSEAPQVARAGHIPGAVNVSTANNVYPNARFCTVKTLESTHADLDPTQPTVVYCSSGARAAHEWFVLHHLLGWADVRVYDGSWSEWGNRVKAPIAH